MKFRTHYENLFSKIFKFAGSIYKEKKQDEKVVVIKGRQNIINFINILIKGAEKRIAMSIWKEEIDDITSELNNALIRGVALKGIYFGRETAYETLVSHRISKCHLLAKKERYISIIIDGTHTLSGIVSRGEESKVTWTKDEGFIELSEDYIAHDLVLNLYSASLDKETFRKFEKFSARVYKEYFDYSDEEFAIDKNIK